MTGDEIPMLRWVLAANPSPMTLEGTRTYIVGREQPVVIDPGPALEEHLAAVEAELRGRRPRAILLTHLHPDHAAGAPLLAERTGAPLLGGAGALDRNLLPRLGAQQISPGERVPVDGGVLQIVTTPGHVPEHLAYHWSGAGAPKGDAIFVGDLLMGIGDTTLVSPPEGDLYDYLGSLRRLEELGAGVLYPAHGPPIERPAEAIERYRAHRTERIRQVAEARRERPAATPEELLDVIYGETLHVALRPAAAGSIAAVMRFLEREREQDGSRGGELG